MRFGLLSTVIDLASISPLGSAAPGWDRSRFLPQTTRVRQYPPGAKEQAHRKSGATNQNTTSTTQKIQVVGSGLAPCRSFSNLLALLPAAVPPLSNKQ